FDARVDKPDYEKHPALRQVEGQVAELEHGDALYIPPGWWHFVEYRDIGFSMSQGLPAHAAQSRADALQPAGAAHGGRAHAKNRGPGLERPQRTPGRGANAPKTGADCVGCAGGQRDPRISVVTRFWLY